MRHKKDYLFAPSFHRQTKVKCKDGPWFNKNAVVLSIYAQNSYCCFAFSLMLLARDMVVCIILSATLIYSVLSLIYSVLSGMGIPIYIFFEAQ